MTTKPKAAMTGATLLIDPQAYIRAVRADPHLVEKLQEVAQELIEAMDAARKKPKQWRDPGLLDLVRRCSNGEYEPLEQALQTAQGRAISRLQKALQELEYDLDMQAAPEVLKLIRLFHWLAENMLVSTESNVARLLHSVQSNRGGGAKPRADGDKVAKRWHALKDAGHPSPTKATAEIFGISERRVRTLRGQSPTKTNRNKPG